MKAVYRIIPVIIVIAALAGCSMGEEMAVIRLSLGQAEVARAVSLSEVGHIVVFSGPGEGKTVQIAPGGGSVSVSVAPGTWTITVTAYYQNQVYATGSATANVSAGKTTNVSIQMTVVYVEPPPTLPPTNPTTPPVVPPVDPVDPPVDPPELSAQGLEPAMRVDSAFYWNPTICVANDEIYAYCETDPEFDPEGFVWQWIVGGVDANPAFIVHEISGETYTVQNEDVGKEIKVILTHSDYKGSITLDPMLVYRGLDSTNFPDFALQLGMVPEFPDDGNYVLLDDITSLLSATRVGSSFYPFKGTFDGNGNTINLGITSEELDGHMGLFALIGPSGTVKNLNVNATINVMSLSSGAYYYVGAVAGMNQGKIFNVFVLLDSPGIHFVDTTSQFYAYIGGIAGWNKNSISNCYVAVTSFGAEIYAENILGSQIVAGGISGWNEDTIHHCWTDGINVNAQGNSIGSAGGSIVGSNDGSIKNCVAIGYGDDINCTDPSFAGRIWGAGNVGGSADNYSDDSITQYGTTVTGLSNNRDGEDITSAEYGAESWWTGTAGWGSVWDGWDEAKPWVFGPATPKLWFN